jgi:hypothetical protein
LNSGTDLCRKNRRTKKSNAPAPIEELNNAYNIFIEVMENPSTQAMTAFLNTIKPESQPPINLHLFEKKDKIDYKIKGVTRYILRVIGFN